MDNANLAGLGTTVVVWAHPDDETYLSGGTAAALVGSGQRVVAVTATRGEAGGPDPSPRGRAETARIRTAELEEALRILGLREHVWLGYEDGRCADADPERAVRRLARLFDYVRPELERHGDLEMATVLMGRLRARGTGAARQRAVLAHQGTVADVVDWLAQATRGEA